MTSIDARLKRIEGVAGKATERIIQIWQDDNDTEAEAIKKYETANNTKIRPDEKVWLIGWLK